VFKRLRVAVLVYVALLVALGHFLTAARSTDWDATLWVDVYPLAGDGGTATREFVAASTLDDLDGIEPFLAREAHRHGVALDRPFRLNLAPPIDGPLPALAAQPGVLATMLWSLRMRWFVAKLEWASERPAADIVVFAVYHDGATTTVLDRSMALEKGLIAVANLFADRAARGSNQVVLAHELLHTLGATDKYSYDTNMPRFPEGFAAPGAQPLLPQTHAELMAGRIAISEIAAEIPASLQDVVIGAVTAAEIGWRSAP
jgi:hypothetical protein